MVRSSWYEDNYGGGITVMQKLNAAATQNEPGVLPYQRSVNDEQPDSGRIVNDLRLKEEETVLGQGGKKAGVSPSPLYVLNGSHASLSH